MNKKLDGTNTNWITNSGSENIYIINKCVTEPQTCTFWKQTVFFLFFLCIFSFLKISLVLSSASQSATEHIQLGFCNKLSTKWWTFAFKTWFAGRKVCYSSDMNHIHLLLSRIKCRELVDRTKQFQIKCHKVSLLTGLWWW